MTLLFEPFAPLFELSRQLSSSPGMRSFLPPADVVVTDDDVTVTMDLPGMTADDVAIELRDDVLTVKGERANPHADQQDGDQRAWRYVERGFGKFERTVRLPAGLDPETIAASLDAGVLTLRIPKPEARKPHRIAIGGGQNQAIEGTATEQRELAGAAA